jgi:hypothetical protein
MEYILERETKFDNWKHIYLHFHNNQWFSAGNAGTAFLKSIESAIGYIKRLVLDGKGIQSKELFWLYSYVNTATCI